MRVRTQACPTALTRHSAKGSGTETGDQSRIGVTNRGPHVAPCPYNARVSAAHIPTSPTPRAQTEAASTPSTPAGPRVATAAPHARSLLDRYQPWRRWVEPGFWIFLYTSQAAINTQIATMDVARAHYIAAAWGPATWEWSSHLVMLALVPLLIAFERRFPLDFGHLRRNLPLHALATLVFSALHVAAMVAVRKLVYLAMSSHYDFGNWPREFFYEYLKDWRTYVTILLIVAAYRLLILRLQGEARLLDAPDDEGALVEPVERPDRFLVRKLGKEFLVAANDIEFLQASGNYVNLHVRGRDYPLRITMAALEPRLDPARFVRVHRSWMVNLDCIAQIEPLETGDARVQLRDGKMIPCSRTYRGALKR